MADQSCCTDFCQSKTSINQGVYISNIETDLALILKGVKVTFACAQSDHGFRYPLTEVLGTVEYHVLHQNPWQDYMASLAELDPLPVRIWPHDTFSHGAVEINLFILLSANSAEESWLHCFLIFTRKQTLTFHVDCLHSSMLSNNV